MRGRVVLLAVLLVALAAAYLYADYSRDTPETFYDDPVRQFKYGSTGGDRLAGIPEGIFKALPQLCPEYLPGKGWESLGFVFEEGMDRPVGTSKRYNLGFERIALNCAACHVGTYRESAQSKPVPVAGMPAHQLDLGGFTQFLTNARSTSGSTRGRWSRRRSAPGRITRCASACCSNTSRCRR